MRVAVCLPSTTILPLPPLAHPQRQKEKDMRTIEEYKAEQEARRMARRMVRGWQGNGEGNTLPHGMNRDT